MIYWQKSDGGFILITFTDTLTSAVSGNESHFTVSWQEYDKVPEGNLVTKSYSPLATHAGADDTELVLEMDWDERFINVVGRITVSYDGAGTLAGEGGGVEEFEVSFAPTGLVPKPNQNTNPHLEIASASKTSVLTRIYYSSAKDSGHHLNIASASWTGTLTHIDDL